MLSRIIVAAGLVAAIIAAVVWSETNRASLRAENEALTARLATAEWTVVQAANARQVALVEAARHKATADLLRADMDTIIKEGLGNEMLDPALRDILNRRLRDRNTNDPGIAGSGPGLADDLPRR